MDAEDFERVFRAGAEQAIDIRNRMGSSASTGTIVAAVLEAMADECRVIALRKDAMERS